MLGAQEETLASNSFNGWGPADVAITVDLAFSQDVILNKVDHRPGRYR